jgi:hypothetical protein
VTVSCGVFELQKSSAIWQDPEAYGVRVAPPGRGDDLVTRFDYAPVPDGAFRDLLLQRIRRRFEAAAPQMRCGIHAHSLLWLTSVADAPAARAGGHVPLDALGVPPGVALRTFLRDPSAPARRVEKTLAYALDASSCTELGGVGEAVLGALRSGARVSALLAGLTPPERRRVRRVMGRLAARGLVRAAPDAPERRTGT